MAGSSDAQALLLTVSADTSKALKALEQLNQKLSGMAPEMERKGKAAAEAIEKSFGSITALGFTDMLRKTAQLQDQLTAAQKAGNSEEAKALREQIALQNQLQRAASAQLETQLMIARATGNKAKVAQLTEALTLQRQVSKFQSVGLSGSRAVAEAEKVALALGAAEKAAEGVNLGKALDSVFDATRLKILDSGIARVGLFGSALEALGPAGIAAAIGVVAVTGAFAEARGAAKFADDIHDTAERLHVTTDALQEYRYAIRAAGGEEKGADEALESFSSTLGKAAAGLPKALRPFRELFGKDFTAKDVQGLGSVEEAITKVQAKLQGLSNTQKDAIVDQFGLTGLKDLLEKPVSDAQRLFEEAKKLGLVMDAELVKRGADLNDEFETAAKVIDVQLKSAFIDVAPLLLDLVKQMAELAKGAAAVADAFRDIEHKSTERLKGLAAEFEARADTPATFLFGGPGKDRERAARVRAELARRAAADKPPGIKPTSTLADVTPVKEGPRDDTAQRTESVNATLASAAKELLQAQLALTSNIEERAAIEKRIADAELAESLARIEKQKADITGDKGMTGAADPQRLADLKAQVLADPQMEAAQRDALLSELSLAKTKKDELKAALSIAEATRSEAAEAKQSLADRQARFALEDVLDETRRQLVDAQIKQLEAAAASADTEAQRTAIEKRILDLRQQEFTHELGKTLSRQVETGALTQDQADQRFQAGLSTLPAERQQFALQHQTPLERYLKSVQDFNTEVENAGISAFDNLASGLADAIANAEDLGDVAKKVFSQLVADLLAAAIRKDLAAPILGLFGFAEGGSVRGPGSGTSDSILARLSDGEFVVRAEPARRYGPLLEAINSGKRLRLPGFAAGGFVSTPAPVPVLAALPRMPTPQPAGLTIIPLQPLSLDLRGAVMTKDLLAQMEALVRQGQAKSVATAVRIAGRQAPARMEQLHALGT